MGAEDAYLEMDWGKKPQDRAASPYLKLCVDSPWSE